MNILNKKNILLSASAILFLSSCGGEVAGTAPKVADAQDYTIKVIDDPVRGATIIAPECKSFEEGVAGAYTLKDCSSKPPAIAVQGGFVDLNNDGIKDSNETDMGMPLLLNTSQTDNLVITPLSTLVANAQNDAEIEAIATSLGLNKSDFYIEPTASGANAKHQDILRAINAVLIQAKNLGVEDNGSFLEDFRTSIKESAAGTDPLDKLTKAQNYISQKASSDEYRRKYGVVFSGFVVDSFSSSTDTKQILRNIANQNKVASDKVVFTGFIYDDIISNATINLYKVDSNGEYIKPAVATVTSDAVGKWKIEIDRTILDTDQVLVFEGTATITKVVNNQNVNIDVRLNTSLSTLVLRNLFDNSINTADVNDITITNVTTAKLSMLKLLDAAILTKPEVIVKKKQLIEKNENLQEILLTTASTVKNVIDEEATLEISNTVKDDTAAYADEVAKNLLEAVYNTITDAQKAENDEKKKDNLDTTIETKVQTQTGITSTQLDKTNEEIKKDRTLNKQLNSTTFEKFKVTTNLVSNKLIKVKYDDDSGKFELKLFSDKTFIKTEDITNTTTIGKWSIDTNGDLILGFTTTTSAKLSFKAMSVQSKGSYDGNKTFEIQIIKDLDNNEKAPLVEFTDAYIANNEVYDIDSGTAVRLDSTNSSVSNGKLLITRGASTREYTLKTVTEKFLIVDENGSSIALYLDKALAQEYTKYNAFTSNSSHLMNQSSATIYSSNNLNVGVLENNYFKFEINPVSETSLDKSIGALTYTNSDENTLGAQASVKIENINANTSRQRAYLSLDYLLKGCALGDNKELRAAMIVQHNKIKLVVRYKDSEVKLVDHVMLEDKTLNKTYGSTIYIKDNKLYAYLEDGYDLHVKTVDLETIIGTTRVVDKLNKYHTGASLYNNEAKDLYDSTTTLNTPIKGKVYPAVEIRNSTDKLVTSAQQCTTTDVVRTGITLGSITLQTPEDPYTYNYGVWGVQEQGNLTENSVTFTNNVYSLKAVSTTTERSRTRLRYKTDEENVIGYKSTIKLNSVGTDSAANQRAQMNVKYEAEKANGDEAHLTVGVLVKKTGIYLFADLWDEKNNTTLVSDYIDSANKELHKTTGDFLGDELDIAIWIGNDKKLYVNINGNEKVIDMSTWDFQGYILVTQAEAYEGRADIKNPSTTTQEVNVDIKDVSTIKGTVSYLPNANDVETVTVSGKVIFKDSSGNVIDAPSDARIRITSESDQQNYKYYNAFNLDIADNGDFNSTRTILFNTYKSGNNMQVAIFKNHINSSENEWNCGEDTYKVIGSVAFDSLSNNIEVLTSDYQDRSGENCTGLPTIPVVQKTISSSSDYTNDTIVFDDIDPNPITISGIDIDKVYMAKDSTNLYIAIDRAGLAFPTSNEYNYWIYFEGNKGHNFELENYHTNNTRSFRIKENAQQISETPSSADTSNTLMTMQVPLSVLDDDAYKVSLFSHSADNNVWGNNGEIRHESEFYISLGVTAPVTPPALDSNLYPTINWDANRIEFFKHLASGTFDSKTALDPFNFILGSPYYEMEYENENNEEKIIVSKLSFSISNLTNVSLDFERSINGATFESDNDPILGGDQFTLSNNVLTISNDARNISVKFVENDVSSATKFNDTQNQVFSSTARSYTLVMKVNTDSHGFYRKVNTYGNIDSNPTQEHYTSIAEFILNQRGDHPIWQNNSGTGGVTFSSNASGTSGTLVEVTNTGSPLQSNAGTWSIQSHTFNNKTIDILKIVPTISGYDTDRYYRIYAVEAGTLYEGELQKAGVEESIIVHNAQAKDDFVAKFTPPSPSIDNTFGGENLASKTFYQVFFGDGLDGNGNTINDVAVVEQVTIDAQGNTTVTSISNSENGSGVTGILNNRFYQKDNANAQYNLDTYNEYVSGSFQSGCVKTNYVENGNTTGVDFFFSDLTAANGFASSMTASTTSCP